MVKLSDLKIVKDEGGGHSIFAGGTWYNLEPRDIRLEDLILKKECEICPKEVMEKCIILYDIAERGAFCEVNADAVRQAKFAEAPSPQIGKLYEDYQKKHAPKPVEVIEKPAPEPAPKASFLDKVKSFIG